MCVKGENFSRCRAHFDRIKLTVNLTELLCLQKKKLIKNYFQLRDTIFQTKLYSYLIFSSSILDGTLFAMRVKRNNTQRMMKTIRSVLRRSLQEIGSDTLCLTNHLSQLISYRYLLVLTDLINDSIQILVLRIVVISQYNAFILWKEMEGGLHFFLKI